MDSDTDTLIPIQWCWYTDTDGGRYHWPAWRALRADSASGGWWSGATSSETGTAPPPATAPSACRPEDPDSLVVAQTSWHRVSTANSKRGCMITLRRCRRLTELIYVHTHTQDCKTTGSVEKWLRISYHPALNRPDTEYSFPGSFKKIWSHDAADICKGFREQWLGVSCGALSLLKWSSWQKYS